MKLSFRVLWGVAALSVLAITATAYASKPVYWRTHPWEDLVGHAGNPAKGDFRIYVIKDHTKPCAPGKNKYNVNAIKLTGQQAYQWLASRRLAVINPRTGLPNKTRTYNDWAFSKKSYSTNPNNGLYWQKACMGTRLKSGCGDLYTDAQRRYLIKTFLDPKKRQWDKTAVRTYAIYGGLKADMLNPNYHPRRHYQANVDIWKQKVNCVHRCVMATPKDFQVNRAAVQRYRQCMARCEAIRFKKCP